MLDEPLMANVKSAGLQVDQFPIAEWRRVSVTAGPDRDFISTAIIRITQIKCCNPPVAPVIALLDPIYR